MCGITGIINLDEKPVTRDILIRMNDAQVHRGPDENGIFIDRNVGLAHRRLSIIDLSQGHQPLGNEDGTIQIVFNGEIYNCMELRRRLEQQGHIFKTHCDTEVIVHLYEEYGTGCAAKLAGMFAFAIYDSVRRKMFFVRDRLGKKPLFYFSNNNFFMFSSELSGMKMHPGMPAELNLQAIHDYLSLQYIPSPDTVFKGVCKLPPAHYLELDLNSGKKVIEQYWQADYSAKTGLNFEDAVIRLRELLFSSVKRRLMSDVPLGAFLSGGLDSSIITGIMSRLCEQPVKTFTIGFNEIQYDERYYAHAAADAINRKSKFPLEYHEKVVEQNDFSTLEKLVAHYGEPYSDASMLPTFLLSKFSREKVTVALSGDGADEIFAGYERYLLIKYLQMLDMIPNSLRKVFFGSMSKILNNAAGERTLMGRLNRTLQVAASSAEHRYLDIINRFREPLKAQLYGSRFDNLIPVATYEIFNRKFKRTTAIGAVEKVMELDLYTYLPGDILTKVDIASMACSLEVRSPFLDHEVVEFAASLPQEYKQKGTSRKHILKEAFKDMLTPELLNRQKRGFGVPLAIWFRSSWKNILHERLLEGRLVNENFFKRNAVSKMLNDHCSGNADLSYPLWSLLILELFLEQNPKCK